MAENVKRRVAAARLAVAFVAAGAIAGASAWAQGAPPPPTAQSSALNAYLKLDSVKGENVVDGSLLFKDMKKHEVPSFKVFQKVQLLQKKTEKVEILKYAKKTELDAYVKGESSDYVKHKDFDGLYVKSADADARYIKMGDAVNGDGSVHTATAVVAVGQTVKLLDVPSMFTVDAMGPTIRITNTSGAPLQYSKCSAAGGGTLAPGGHLDCDDGKGALDTLQLVTGGAAPGVVTINFSAISVQGGSQSTVQVLIGL